jgi:molecular chaperone DnaK (HSP70)
MSITIGLDFGSLGYRAAYLLEEEIISVPIPPDAAFWQGLIFVDPDPNELPLGFSFSSLKYQLGTGRQFNWRGGVQLPEDAVGEIFADIKRAVETYAGEEIGRAVIAVPAQYPASRRAIVRGLAEAAGFGRVGLINDCTAAALGHTHNYTQEKKERARTLLLYSMGFIGFEVSLVRYARERLRELTHEGAKTPSGRDFDVQTMVTAVERLHRDQVHLPMRVFTSHWFDFRFLASDLKERLSVVEEADLQLPPHITGKHTIDIRFRRDAFEAAVAGRVEVTLDVVQRALEDIGMKPEDVDEVVLVGGSTRVGLIQRRLAEIFGDEKLVQPRDGLIARGAAVQAHHMEQQVDKEEGLLLRQPPYAVEGTGTTATPGRDAPFDLRHEPDPEPLFAYARQLAGSGQAGAAIRFLEDLETHSRVLREQLSERVSEVEDAREQAPEI